jgi:hypothetical protein
MVPTFRAAALVAIAMLVPAVAMSQAPASSSAAAAASTARPPVAGGGASAQRKAQPSGAAARAAHAKSSSPGAIMPGFEALADGSTRLFVELSQPVAYDARAGRGTLTYVLKGAHVDRRNNYNPLVTVHFNTPVSQARLEPHGKDLWFVIDLRANVQPTAAMDAAKDGGAMLRVEFPKGDYLPRSAPADSAPPAASSAASP